MTEVKVLLDYSIPIVQIFLRHHTSCDRRGGKTQPLPLITRITLIYTDQVQASATPPFHNLKPLLNKSNAAA